MNGVTLVILTLNEIEGLRHIFPKIPLHAVDEVGDRRRHDPGAGVELPELLAVARAVGGENAVGAALEHEVAGRREHAAAFDDRVGRMPRGALRDL